MPALRPALRLSPFCGPAATREHNGVLTELRLTSSEPARASSEVVNELSPAATRGYYEVDGVVHIDVGVLDVSHFLDNSPELPYGR